MKRIGYRKKRVRLRGKAELKTGAILLLSFTLGRIARQIIAPPITPAMAEAAVEQGSLAPLGLGKQILPTIGAAVLAYNAGKLSKGSKNKEFAIYGAALGAWFI